MRYFYYDNEQVKKEKDIFSAESNGGKGKDEISTRIRNQKDSGLVIEEDTIYEIDEECIACKRRHNAL